MIKYLSVSVFTAAVFLCRRASRLKCRICCKDIKDSNEKLLNGFPSGLLKNCWQVVKRKPDHALSVHGPKRAQLGVLAG